jgi:hypothetical protein
MPKIEFSDGKGLVSKKGSGVVFKGSVTQDQTPGLVANVTAASATITKGGYYTLTQGGISTITLPAAADVPGQLFVFRATDTQAHILTGSGGDSVVAPMQANQAGMAKAGAKVQFPVDDGAHGSLSLISDGGKFLVVGASGSFTVSEFPS